MIAVVGGGAWAIFLIVAVLDGSLVRVGIAVALYLAVHVGRAYRVKRMNDEMKEMERWK